MKRQQTEVSSDSAVDSPVLEHHGGSYGNYFEQKQLKVQAQFQSERFALRDYGGEETSEIFDGVIAYVNGEPEVSLGFLDWG